MQPGLAPEEYKDDKAAVGADPAEATAADQKNAFEKDFGNRGTTPDRPSFTSGNTPGPNAASNPFKSVLSNGKLLKRLGVGGGISVLVISIFLALVAAKLEMVMKSILSHEYQRVEDYAEHRAERVAIRYLYLAVGSDAPEAIYAEGSIMRDLFINMRKNKFERKLLANHGLKLEKVPGRPGAIRVVAPDGSPKNLKNEAEFIAYLEGGSVRGKEAKRLIKLTVKEETHFYQVLKRKHFRRYLANAYNIHRWGAKSEDEEKKKADLPEGVTPMAADVQEVVLAAVETQATSTVTCLVEGDDCPDPEKRKAPDGSSPATSRDPDRTANNNDPKADGERQNASESAKTETKNAYQKVRDTTSAATEKALTKLFGEVITKGLLKAVPIVGWVALAADVDHFFWDRGGEKIVVAAHEAQYVALSTTWTSLADQWKEFKLSLTQFGYLSRALDGSEKSNAFHRTILHDDGGEKIADDKKVGSDRLSQPLTDGSFTKAYRVVATPWHYQLSAVRGAVKEATHIFGSIFQFLGLGGLAEAFGNLVEKVGSATGVEQLALDSLSWVFDKVIKPVVHGREHGVALVNGVDAGWDVAANAFARDGLGAHNISAQLAVAQTDRALAREREDLAHSDLITRVFSTESTQTLASRVIALTPTGPQTMASYTNTAIARMVNPISLLASLFSDKAHASLVKDGREPNGVQQTGYTDTEINSDLDHFPTTDIAGEPNEDGSPSAPDGKIDSNDCPRIDDPNVANMCLLDTADAEAMNSMYTKDNDGGIGDGQSSSPAEDSASGSLPTGSAKQLAKDILADTQIKLLGCASTDINATANTGAPINPKLLQLILGSSKAGFHLTIGTLASCHNPGTLHAQGRAMDVNGLNGNNITSYELPFSQFKDLYDWMTAHNKSGEFGTPNAEFLTYVRGKGASDSFIDRGTGPHLHFGVNE